MRPSLHRSTSCIPIGVAAALALLLSVVALDAQAKATPTQFKGVLEPVSYTEDLPLRDVFFVTVDVGWVAGNGGTILRTTDGGAKWEVQLGGDPADRADPVRVLHFLDERRGWAVQGQAGGSWKTLHTRDGESWEEIGSAPFGVDDIAFTSPQTGFAAGNPGMTVNGPNVMYRTSDGGRTWKPVWTCEAKVALGGVTQNLSCVIGQIRFPTPEVGYAVARRSSCVGCGPPPLIAKTTDAGQTWTLLTGPGLLEEDAVSAIFFLDELTGFVRLDSKKLHMTTDGGKTWRGIVASPGEALRFADPTVGWGVELGRVDFRWSYTTDGGKRWTSREVRLPAVTRGFSLPRRDRAYVVGDHGMIFRYRVVPASHSLGPNDIAMPAMPAFESALDEQVKELEQVVTELGSSLSAASGAQGGAAAGAVAGAATDSAGAGAAAASAAAAGEPLNAPLPPASQFTAQCCKKSFSRLEVILGALSQTLPEFIGKYKNLNLLLAAVRMGSELPGEYRAVKGGLKSFRQAKDKETATAALAGVSAALSALKQTTAVSMQQQLPPPPSAGAGVEGAGGAPAVPDAAASSAPQDAGAAATNVVADTVKAVAKDAAKEAADKMKKGLGGLLRKRKP